jgi:hypothetical protein
MRDRVENGRRKSLQRINSQNMKEETRGKRFSKNILKIKFSLSGEIEMSRISFIVVFQELTKELFLLSFLVVQH